MWRANINKRVQCARWLCISFLGITGLSLKVSHLLSKHPCGFLCCRPDQAQKDQCPALVQKDSPAQPSTARHRPASLRHRAKHQVSHMRTFPLEILQYAISAPRHVLRVHVWVSESHSWLMAHQFMCSLKCIYIDNQCRRIQFPGSHIIFSWLTDIWHRTKSDQSFLLHSDDTHCSPHRDKADQWAG